MNLVDMPILNGLTKYINQNITPFHMPGHKSNIIGFEELEFIREKLYEIDKTEVPGLDNLHIPEGMILEAERFAARAFKADRSFLLVNGSTCGIYSMIMGVTKPGDKIIVQRNCHRSVFMACLLGDLRVEYLNPDIDNEFNIAGGVPINTLIEVMEINPDAKAVVVTYPSYHGICSNIEDIINEAHRRGILVLVDEAHGAHFPFSVRLPKSSIECGADASVVSVHKSLPALTQASILNIRAGMDDIGIKFMLRLFQSTSPSYVLMASIDAARGIMENKGELMLDTLFERIERFSLKLSNSCSYKILNKDKIGSASIHDIDITKIVIASKHGGLGLDMRLRNYYNIQVEMSDTNNITLISTICDNEEAFERLYTALYKIDREDNSIINVLKPPLRLNTYKTELNMREAYYSRKAAVELKNSCGLISGEMVVPYPPGIPVLLPGEIITREIIDYIEYTKEKGISLNGINDSTGEKIMVIDI